MFDLDALEAWLPDNTDLYFRTVQMKRSDVDALIARCRAADKMADALREAGDVLEELRRGDVPLAGENFWFAARRHAANGRDMARSALSAYETAKAVG